MHFLEYYYKTVVKYDFLNKFHYYKEIKSIPKIQKVVLNFGCRKTDFKLLLSSLLALELITLQKSHVTKSRKTHIFVKIKKGSPVGGKVVLRKNLMFVFIANLINSIFPKIKQFKGFKFANSIGLRQKVSSKNGAVSFKIKNNLLFSELESHYQCFKNLPELNITIVTNCKNSKELLFLLRSFKLPFYR